MVALRRRIAVLVITLFASLSAAGLALASGQDVINDYIDGGTISSCHPRADYDAARSLPVDPTYGDPQGAIDDALANPALVGTAEQPCAAVAAPGDSGGSGIALVLIPIAVVVLGGAILFARRRREEPAEDADQPS